MTKELEAYCVDRSYSEFPGICGVFESAHSKITHPFQALAALSSQEQLGECSMLPCNKPGVLSMPFCAVHGGEEEAFVLDEPATAPAGEHVHNWTPHKAHESGWQTFTCYQHNKSVHYEAKPPATEPVRKHKKAGIDYCIGHSVATEIRDGVEVCWKCSRVVQPPVSGQGA